MKVYFISGLAADSRVFRHIRLPEGFEMEFLEWIQPYRKESLSGYSARLAEKIDTNQAFAVVGLSMGGMIAIEIANKFHPKKTILISSISACNQLPPHYKLAHAIRLHKIIPAGFFKSLSILKRVFTTDSIEDRKILTQVIRDSDPAFIRWALDAILSWKNKEIPTSLFHIHGTKDEILPFRYINPSHIIKKGNHLMIMSRADEINEFLRVALAEE